MEEGGSFIFCVSDFSKVSFSAFQTMKETAEYTDVTIRCNGRTFLAHRVVLAARIPHFRNILSSQGSEISLDEIDPDVLESLISFAYEGKLKVTAENVLPMLMVTTLFQLDGIHKACCEFLSKTPASSNNVGGTHACIKLVPSDHNIRENFDEFSDTEEFLFLPYSSIKDLVSRNDLKVESEEKVFEAVMKWIKMSPTERQHLLPYLLTKIRMANLTPDYLIEKVATEEVIRSSDQCKHIVEEAKTYHLLPNKRSMFLSFNTDSRLYINSHRTPSRNDNSTTATRENVTCSNTMSGGAPNPSASRVNSTSNTATHKNVVCSNTMSPVPNPSALPLNSTSNTATRASVAYRNTMSTTPNQSASRINVTATTTNYNVSNQNSCSYKIEDGVYAVCCTDSETLVGYFDNQDKKCYCFQASTRIDEIVGVTVVNDELYVFFPYSVEVFHLRNHEWTAKYLTPGNIKASGIVCYLESIYIFGGFNCKRKIRRFNPQQKKWLPDEKMRHGWRNMGVTSYLGKYICLTGGFITYCCRSVEKYNPITKEWTEMPDMLLDRMDHGCASLNDKIYICGGRFNSTRCMNTAEVYDSVSDQWTSIASITLSRFSLSLVPWDGKLYAFGGRTKKKIYLRRLEVFSPENNKWASDVNVSTLSQEKRPVVVKVLKVVSTVMSSSSVVGP